MSHEYQCCYGGYQVYIVPPVETKIVRKRTLRQFFTERPWSFKRTKTSTTLTEILIDDQILKTESKILMNTRTFEKFKATII